MWKSVIAQTFFVTLLFALGVVNTQAHTSGASIEVMVDSYLLDIGYTPEVVSVGTQTRFDFSILNASNSEEIIFDDIWVRIEKDGRVFFAGGLSKQQFGSTGVTHLFTEAGTYEVFVRFSNAGEKLAEATFDFPVTEDTVQSTSPVPFAQKAWLVFVGVVVGSVATWFVKDGRKRN